VLWAKLSPLRIKWSHRATYTRDISDNVVIGRMDADGSVITFSTAKKACWCIRHAVSPFSCCTKLLAIPIITILCLIRSTVTRWNFKQSQSLHNAQSRFVFILCICFGFLPRDAMHGADYAAARWSSGTVSKQIISSNIYFTVGKPHHSSFIHTKRYGDIPTGPLMAARMQGIWKTHDFQPIYHFILEMIQDGAILNMKYQ